MTFKTLLRENVNGLAVLGGACWLYVGLAGFSPHAADVVAGVLLMAIGLVPYLRRLRKRHT
jgi:hypothetical protein